MQKKFKVLQPISFYGRKEIGEIIAMTDEEFKAFGNDYLEEVKEASNVSQEEEKKENKQKKTKNK